VSEDVLPLGRKHPSSSRRLRVLFLCTHNSARSQIAEALFARKGGDRFTVASAGSAPARRVHPLAVEALADLRIDWSTRTPKGIDDVKREPWDLIITVCDRARESCPTFPHQPAFAHWSMEDPTEAQGEAAQRRAFRETITYLSRRIDLLLALPFESLERSALERRARDLGRLPSRDAE